jgi:hypothetical protein
VDPTGAHFEVDRQLVTEFAQLVLEEAAPEELVIFEETAAEYFADPAGVLHPKRRDEAVGFGLDLAMLTPYVLAVVSSCLAFLLKTVAETATSEATKPAIGDLLRRLLRRKRPDASEHAAALSGEQLASVRQVAFERARDLGLSEERSRLLADAVAGGLNVAGSPSGPVA